MLQGMIQEKRKACRVLAEKTEGKRPLGRPRGRYNDNIKMDIKVILEAVDWIHVAQDRGKWWAVWYAKNLRFHEVLEIFFRNY